MRIPRLTFSLRNLFALLFLVSACFALRSAYERYVYFHNISIQSTIHSDVFCWNETVAPGNISITYSRREIARLEEARMAIYRQQMVDGRHNVTAPSHATTDLFHRFKDDPDIRVQAYIALRVAHMAEHQEYAVEVLERLNKNGDNSFNSHKRDLKKKIELFGILAPSVSDQELTREANKTWYEKWRKEVDREFVASLINADIGFPPTFDLDVYNPDLDYFPLNPLTMSDRYLDFCFECHYPATIDAIVWELCSITGEQFEPLGVVTEPTDDPARFQTSIYFEDRAYQFENEAQQSWPFYCPVVVADILNLIIEREGKSTFRFEVLFRSQGDKRQEFLFADPASIAKLREHITLERSRTSF